MSANNKDGGLLPELAKSYDERSESNGRSRYDPSAFEADIYAQWEASGAFAPIDSLAGGPKAKPFCIIAPPPNANGALHIGHAVFVTLQDVMIRCHRMKGDATLWLPGFDHAGFETQVVYEKKLEKEGRSRFQIPRDQLYQEMYDFTQANLGTMTNQLKKLGASMDWSRQQFTLDPAVVKLVYQNFKKLYDDDLVYRSVRPVNWCTKHQTSLSDLEVRYEERVDPLYYIKYGPLTLATVRPETKFGDTALAVNPKDSRYKQYIGQKIEYTSLLGKASLQVIGDDYVDPEFGTGVVKITPAHDPNDFEVAARHNLPAIEVIDQYGKLTDKAGIYAGLKVKEARAKVAADLEAKGLLIKTEANYSHTVGVCYKCGTVIEPRILPQWFIAMTKTGHSGKNLRDDAVKAVKEEQVQFVTPKFATVFDRWMEGLRDWNISRQIVWGIQLPIWYCQCRRGPNNSCDCPPIITDGSTPEVCSTCDEKSLVRDPDVFDTWFSSGQWPVVALQVQNRPNSDDFARFYPTSVMETAYDILFFWVARMIMLGLYLTDAPPFKQVYIHGLVRDKERQKMSKSKGNVIDPLGVAAQYGSDAVRMALIFGTSAGNDIVIAEDKIKGMRNFANKLWNISRFINLNIGDGINKATTCTLADLADIKPQTEADKTMLSGLDNLTKEVTANLEAWQFHLAAEKLYEFSWHQFADIYLEASKKQLAEIESELATNTRKLLLQALLTQISLLHPMMPFVTEAIYQSLPIHGKPILLMTARWPAV